MYYNMITSLRSCIIALLVQILLESKFKACDVLWVCQAWTKITEMLLMDMSFNWTFISSGTLHRSIHSIELLLKLYQCRKVAVVIICQIVDETFETQLN